MESSPRQVNVNTGCVQERHFQHLDEMRLHIVLAVEMLVSSMLAQENRATEYLRAVCLEGSGIYGIFSVAMRMATFLHFQFLDSFSLFYVFGASTLLSTM